MKSFPVDANRAKNIKNKPRINEDPRDAQMKLLQDEINRLKQELLNAGNPSVRPDQKLPPPEKPVNEFSILPKFHSSSFLDFTSRS